MVGLAVAVELQEPRLELLIKDITAVTLRQTLQITGNRLAVEQVRSVGMVQILRVEMAEMVSRLP
jgi:hypothetical protein